MNKYSVTFHVAQYREGKLHEEIRRLVFEAEKADAKTLAQWEVAMKASYGFGNGYGIASATIIFVLKLDE